MIEKNTGIIYDIQPFSVQDGPGIRTTVFLKGCPLHCPWCHSPESQEFFPQLSWISMRCVGCGRCMSACPNGALTRGMLVTVLYRMAGSPKVEGKVSEKFSDCTDGSWYADAVLWASANKVVDGYEDGTFKPTKSITRQEMAKVLYGYDKIGGKTAEGITEKLTYTDLDAIADWALEAVTYCTAEKYLAGSNGAFSPKGTATRAMGAKVLMNMTKEAA